MPGCPLELPPVTLSRLGLWRPNQNRLLKLSETARGEKKEKTDEVIASCRMSPFHIDTVCERVPVPANSFRPGMGTDARTSFVSLYIFFYSAFGNMQTKVCKEGRHCVPNSSRNKVCAAISKVFHLASLLVPESRRSFGPASHSQSIRTTNKNTKGNVSETRGFPKKLCYISAQLPPLSSLVMQADSLVFL